MNDTHDHAKATHTAKCDAENCNYVAEIHAHDDDEAVNMLSQNLAEHNKAEHGMETDVESIKEPVRAKMQRV